MSSPVAVATEVWQTRELLANLIRKELKVRYKGSALGFAWSMITPLALAAIFTLVFATFLRIPFGDGNFTVFFLAGYLVWGFFQNSVMSSAGSIIANGGLISKVYFPRELIPMSLVIAQGVHLLIGLAVVSPLFIWERGFHPELLPAIVVALLLVALFTAGVSMLFGALTVKFRDLTELLPVVMMAWFYLTPIIYSIETIRGAASNGDTWVTVLRVNPMTWFAELFHTLLYGIALPLDPSNPLGSPPHPPPQIPDLATWGVCTLCAALAFVFGYVVFRRSASSFAKQV
ncbi:ABC transporter permease [Euzebya tangerina]|uniref:ABC transporter permease n=1 Tax=Euzebya tangerina TaxID=591198 RepID=UPI0013C37095|nr:ABC transporter permease [Euzebya tangerina]